MTTLSQNRQLKEALGERGSVSFPVMPSLQPVCVVDDLRSIGPVGIPWGFTLTQGAVAGQRSCVQISAPAGMLLVVEFLASSQACDVRIAGAPGPFSVNSSATIADTRQWSPGFDPLAGVLTGGQLNIVAVNSQAAGSQGNLLEFLSANGTIGAPVWVAAPGYVLLQGAADNTGITVRARGRLIVRE